MMTFATHRIAASSRPGLLLAALLASAAALIPSGEAQVHAQAAPTPPASPEPDEPGNDIIVTAQRRAQALEDVPMSVAVLSQESLSNLGVNSVRDLANVTTGLQVNNSGTYPQPAIRGITTINAGTYENNVALFVDGLYQTTAQVLNMDLPNVQNIQVLKGPQGTLYGRNATGGAILIDTIDPGPDFKGQFEAGYGRFDDKRARGYVAGPLAEGIGFSVAGTIRRNDGYNKRASRTTPGETDGRFLGLKQDSIRTKLKFDISDSFRATLGYNYLHVSDPRGVIFTPTENVATPYTPGSGRDTRPRELGKVAGDIFDLNLKQHEGSLRLELDTGVGTIRSITGYTRGKLDTDFDSGGTYVADNYSASRLIDRTWQQAIDLSVNAIDGLDLILGGTYYNITTRFADGKPNSLFLAPPGSLPGTPISSYRRFSDTGFFREKEAWALFADATIHATDRLSIDIGGRYSKENQDVSGFKTFYSIVTGAITATPYTRASSAQGSTYKKFTPRASIRYEIAPRTNVYASYSKGFRAGEWNSVIPGDNPANWRSLGQIGQESVDAYEVGFKTAGRRIRLDVAGFYYDYRNLQVSYTQFVNGAALVILQTVPKAEIYGAEASADYEVIDNLNLRAGATWLHARYGDGARFNGAGVNPAQPAFNSNADPIKNLANQTVAQDLSGKQMSRAPNFAAFAGFDYLIAQGDGGFRFAANAKYTDSYVVTNPSVWGGEPIAAYNARRAADPSALPNNSAILAGTPFASRANQQRARQGRYVLVNASVTWTDPSDHYYVRAWGNNLTDKKYKVHYNPLGGGTYAPLGEPLTYGLTAGYKF